MLIIPNCQRNSYCHFKYQSPTLAATMPLASMKVTNEQEHAVAIEQLIAWNQAPDAKARYADIEALGAIVEAYEIAAGHTPDPPRTLSGILEVEMFKRRIKQRELAEILEVSEPQLNELLLGKNEMNLDFARRLYHKLHIPADVILSIAA